MPRRLCVQRLALGAALVVVMLSGSISVAAAASPIVRLSILHTLHGCHVWMSSKVLGPSTTITIKRGTRLVIRPTCPMDFDLMQIRGPRIALGAPRIVRGSSRVITFPSRGIYRLAAKNVQASSEVGLQTLGSDNVLTLTVVVR